MLQPSSPLVFDEKKWVRSKEGGQSIIFRFSEIFCFWLWVSRVCTELGSASAAHSIIHPSRKTVVIEFGPECLFSIEIQSTSNSVRRPTRVYDPSESSRPQIRVRVSGPFYHPLEKVVIVIEFGSESAGQSILPGHSASQSSSNTSFQVAETQTSLASISGRQSGLGRVYHPPNQICHPSKSIIRRPGPQSS